MLLSFKESEDMYFGPLTRASTWKHFFLKLRNKLEKYSETGGVVKC